MGYIVGPVWIGHPMTVNVLERLLPVREMRREQDDL